MTYLFTAAFVLFAPGYCMTRLTGLQRNRFLLSFSLSYALFVLLFKAVSLAGSGIVVFERIYFSIVMALILLCGISAWRTRQATIPFITRFLSSHRLDLLAIGIIGLLLTAYYLYAGPYLELPADVFQHIEYIRKMNELVASSVTSGQPVPGYYVGINGKFWHLLYVLLNQWSGNELTASILRASLFNNFVFLAGVYFFTKVVFDDDRMSTARLGAVALAVAAFYFLYFGVNIFSFVRYYALAPVMLNMVLYFSIMAIVIEFFRDKEWRWREIITALFIFAASTLIHKQEPLFVVVMVLLMSGYLFFRRIGSSMGDKRPGDPGSYALLRDKSTIVFVPLMTGTIALYVYSLLEVRRNKVEMPKLIPVESLLPFIKNLFILNPTYQFYYVLTLWGLAVIALFFFYRRRFRGNAFIVAGMVSPLFTVFNPVFVDLFLRYSYSIMLWRLSFLVPVCFVGGYVFLDALAGLRQRRGWRKLAPAAAVALLLGLLFPIHTTFIDTPYSRFETLKPVHYRTSPAYWGDLLAFLDGIDDKKIVITDPVTGYLVSAMTKHYSYRAKFYRQWGGYVDFNFKDFSTHPFDQYAGRLLVINLRNGAISRTGRIARHWPANILQVSNYYQMDRLGPYIESNPDRFELLWQRNRIRVYMIHKPKPSSG